MDTLEKAFSIATLVIFAICLIPIINLVYLTWGLFIPAIGFTITNYVRSSKANAKNKNINLIIMILACVGLIPFLGYISRAVGFAFVIYNLAKHK